MSQTLRTVVLGRAIELMRQGWTSHTLARNCDGESISPLFQDAIHFCAQGAMMRAAHEIGLDITEYFDGDDFFSSLVEINDGLGKNAVLASMIAEARNQGTKAHQHKLEQEVISAIA